MKKILVVICFFFIGKVANAQLMGSVSARDSLEVERRDTSIIDCNNTSCQGRIPCWEWIPSRETQLNPPIVINGVKYCSSRQTVSNWSYMDKEGICWTARTIITIYYPCSSNGSGGGISKLAYAHDGAEKKQALVAYPNPASNVITLEFFSDLTEPVNITIANLLGEVVMKSSVTSVVGLNRYQIDIGNLSSGIYIVLTESSQTNQVQKIKISKE